MFFGAATRNLGCRNQRTEHCSLSPVDPLRARTMPHVASIPTVLHVSVQRVAVLRLKLTHAELSTGADAALQERVHAAEGDGCRHGSSSQHGDAHLLRRLSHRCSCSSAGRIRSWLTGTLCDSARHLLGDAHTCMRIAPLAFNCVNVRMPQALVPCAACCLGDITLDRMHHPS